MLSWLKSVEITMFPVKSHRITTCLLVKSLPAMAILNLYIKYIIMYNIYLYRYIVINYYSYYVYNIYIYIHLYHISKIDAAPPPWLRIAPVAVAPAAAAPRPRPLPGRLSRWSRRPGGQPDRAMVNGCKWPVTIDVTYRIMAF